MGQNDDLISREALRHDMYVEAFEKDSDMQKWDSDCWIRYKMFLRVIERQPSAQKTGEWIFVKIDEDEYGNKRFGCKCSECGSLAYEFSQPYCHMCGARMVEQE